MIRWWSLFDKRSITLLLALLVSSAAPAAPGAADYETKVADLERLRARIQSLSGDLNIAQDRRTDLRGELRRLEQEIGGLNEALKQGDVELQVRRENLARLEREKQTQEIDLAGQRRVLGGQLRAAYVIGRQEQLKILLNQENPAALGRNLVYYEYFNRARTERIEALSHTLARLDRLESNIRQQADSLRRLQSLQAEQKQVLEASQELRGQVLAKLDVEIGAKNQELQGLKENERQLQQLLLELERALLAIPEETEEDRIAFAGLKGKLSWPTEGVVQAKYGSSRMEGATTWQGVLIAAREGQAVQSISHGQVAFADWLRGFGQLIIVDHGEGYMSLYGHNRDLRKQSGDWVEAGEIIASVGTSNDREAPGLYFEIRQQGEPANPALWCK